MTGIATGLADDLARVVGPAHVLEGDAIPDDLLRDESLTGVPCRPLAVVRPGSTDEVAAVVTVAGARRVPLTARGSGTGLSGAAIPRADGILVSFERMDRIVDLDLDNHVAVVQPGVTLDRLDAATAEHGLVYPVYPGESSASLGGNVATNAGGMRAVKYGVTRHQVLGVEAVLGTGEVIRAGGRFVKATSGYDLTQLVVGSEGTLALVTEATLRLYPRLDHRATVVAPFATVDEVVRSVPPLLASGLGPMVVEYVDVVTMAAITANAGLELGVPAEVREATQAYLVVVVEQRSADRLDEDVAELAGLLDGRGALDVYVLPPQAGVALITAREQAFWTAKAAGADDIVDMVVPRAAIPAYMARVAELAQASGSLVFGCGHAGDGNVHLSVYQGDEAVRHDLIAAVFAAGRDLGGAVSGEHGIGTAKKAYYLELEDPARLALMRRIKAAFDPAGILNPGKVFD
ncbi:MAG: FAD-binding oxidoreductase [Acidimicrobiia bacterium]